MVYYASKPIEKYVTLFLWNKFKIDIEVMLSSCDLPANEVQIVWQMQIKDVLW